MHYNKLSYKRNFDYRVKPARSKVSIFSGVFAKKYYHPTDEPRHKLETIATGSYQVTDVDDETCVILRDVNVTKSIKLDRVVLEPRLE